MRFHEIKSTELFGPIYHKTVADIDSFKDFDLSMSSTTAVLGPAIYATLNKHEWSPSHLHGGKVLTGYVKGKIIDLTKPQTPQELAPIEKLIGKKLDYVPLVTLERKFGSVANGLRLSGYSAAIHEGPSRGSKHIAVFDSTNIVDAN